MSNWTELDIWSYIERENIPIVPLYFAEERPVVERSGTLILVDDDRLPLEPGEQPMRKVVRFRTLGCYPLSGAIESGGTHHRRDHRRDRRRRGLREAGQADRQGPAGLDGEEEAGGLLLSRPLLRFITCGSVDDGKSTFIGRLLYESRSVFEDQLRALESDSRRFGTQGSRLDFALLVDGLQAEREQGITIDVAYRFFATPHRRFIVADTPGHEQYTRNMATGASTAELAVILIDARKGVLTQTRRHTRIAAMMGIRHVLLAVNKMDLVGYEQRVFEKIVDEYAPFAAGCGVASVRPIPVSSLEGDNLIAARTTHALVRRPDGDALPGDGGARRARRR